MVASTLLIVGGRIAFLLIALAAGASVRLLPDYDPARVARLLSDEPITMEGIYSVLAAGMGQIQDILAEAVRSHASMPATALS